MKFFSKVHEAPEGKILAICDPGLIGKTIEENECVLEIGDFFRGELTDFDEIASELKEAIIVNAIGNNIVSELIKSKIISENDVHEVHGIKHVQIFRI